jgi:hypothetical protein
MQGASDLRLSAVPYWRAKATTMTTTFDKREEGFEQQFAHDEELKFKATARRNKMLGLWAAGKLGLSGAEAENYARSIVLAEFEQGGDRAVIAKIRNDLEAKGITQSEHQITRTMTELMATAIIDIKAGR